MQWEQHFLTSIVLNSSAGQILFISAIHQLLSENCFSTFLHLFYPFYLSPITINLQSLYVFLAVHINHSLHLSTPSALSLSLGSVLVQIWNINQGRLRSSWSAVPSLICRLPSALMCPMQPRRVILLISISSFFSLSLFFLLMSSFKSPFYLTSLSLLAHVFMSRGPDFESRDISIPNFKPAIFSLALLGPSIQIHASERTSALTLTDSCH